MVSPKRNGTSRHGLVGRVVLGRWLSFILEVFSNLNDSINHSLGNAGWCRHLERDIFSDVVEAGVTKPSRDAGAQAGFSSLLFSG